MTTPTQPFQVPIVVRGYELDTQGHLNQAVYLQYAEHARWEWLRAAGITQDALIGSGIGPVVLETTVRYQRELIGGDKVKVSCVLVPGDGKTFGYEHEIQKEDGELAASITGVAGLLDLRERKLLPSPIKHFMSMASKPELLGL